MAGYKTLCKTIKSKDPSHKVNEDKCIQISYSVMNDEEIKLLLVADGMGGLSDGEKAAAMAREGFLQSFHKGLTDIYMDAGEEFTLSHDLSKLEDVIKMSIKAANARVCETADDFVETGTTISVVVIVGNCAVAANVGDSPVYYLDRENNTLKLVSKLQTQAELNVEEGLYKRYSEAYFEESHILYHCLGDMETLRDENIYMYTTTDVHQKDLFLVGSDGAFGELSEDDILDILNDSEYFDVLEQLFKRAGETTFDDQSAIVCMRN